MGIPLQDLSTEMGVTGELVRSVFSKSRSVSTHESNVSHFTALNFQRRKPLVSVF